MQFFKSFWIYLGSCQKPSVKYVHFIIFVLVVSQIIVSNFMNVPNNIDISMVGYNLFFSWLHFLSGFLLFFLTLSLVYLCFVSNGIKNYYPYLWGEIKQIKHDVNELLKLRLPNSQPMGLASSIQGLGLGAMLLVTLSGVFWFLLWYNQQSFSVEIKNLHKSLTGLVELYIVGHGLMGLLHFFINRKLY